MFVTFRGRRRRLTDWCADLGLRVNRAYGRLEAGLAPGLTLFPGSLRGLTAAQRAVIARGAPVAAQLGMDLDAADRADLRALTQGVAFAGRCADQATWARWMGLPTSTLCARLQRGLPPAQALFPGKLTAGMDPEAVHARLASVDRRA